MPAPRRTAMTFVVSLCDTAGWCGRFIGCSLSGVHVFDWSTSQKKAPTDECEPEPEPTTMLFPRHTLVVASGTARMVPMETMCSMDAPRTVSTVVCSAGLMPIPCTCTCSAGHDSDQSPASATPTHCSRSCQPFVAAVSYSTWCIAKPLGHMIPPLA